MLIYEVTCSKKAMSLDLSVVLWKLSRYFHANTTLIIIGTNKKKYLRLSNSKNSTLVIAGEKEVAA